VNAEKEHQPDDQHAHQKSLPVGSARYTRRVSAARPETLVTRCSRVSAAVR